MLNYTVGSDNSENGMICYYGEDEVIGGYPKRKFEEDSEEGFEKGNRKKRYILGQNVGKWTDEEHNRFVLALKKFGRNWTLVQQEVKTRTLVQIRSHAQKYFLKKVRGIAPSTLTMDSKLISTASDGIVPTWLLQDDSNYANKTSINTSSSISQNSAMVNTNRVSNSGKGSNNIGGMNLYIYNESSNPELSIIDEPINLVNACKNLDTANSNGNNNNSSSSDSNCLNDNINNNITGNCTNLDGSNLVISSGMIGNMNILASPILESGGLSPDIRYNNYMGNGLLVDDQRDQCGYHDYRTGLMDLKTEMTPKFDYNPQGGGSIPKQIINDCIFDEPYCDKRVSVDSTSLVSTAVSSPASIGPEKNYIPATSVGLDMLLMPPTVDMKQNDNCNQNSSFQKGFNVSSNNTCSSSNNNNNPRGGNSNDITSSGNNNNTLRSNVGIISDSLNYGFNYSFEDNENIINPSISLSNCDVPWPLTGGDQFLHFNENDNAISSSPSASSSISYLDLDSSAESKQYSTGISTSPNKQYDMGNTFSDFVYCGDSMGIDLLNVYTNLRDSSSPIIDNADVTDFI
ncbi:Myb domain containing [Cryptosporidium sp. chipmunk genotype I]|uniref:Myb domain containing n=1 Tax=Cryptosporidium sp. chipmunk genotype I TaxID=1280935 RepID=UPI00351A2FC0|nr:Myb domain containing [Cryptosporidium sp. chipmunk genotype I]